MSRLRVKIISNQPMCREALTTLARSAADQPDIRAAETPAAGLAAREPCDLLLADLPPDADAAQWIEAAARLPARRRLLVAHRPDSRLARLARDRGFAGLLPKTSEVEVLAAGVRLVLAGGEYFPCFPEALEIARSNPDTLSPRQRQVLAEMVLGATNKEIAQRLGVSLATVKLHVQAILTAAGARNRTEAVTRLRGG